MGSDRASLFLLDHKKKELHAQVFDVHVEPSDVEAELSDLENNNSCQQLCPQREIRYCDRTAHSRARHTIPTYRSVPVNLNMDNLNSQIIPNPEIALPSLQC